MTRYYSVWDLIKERKVNKEKIWGIGELIFLVAMVLTIIKYYLIWTNVPEQVVRFASMIHLNFIIAALLIIKFFFFQEYNLKEMVFLIFAIFIIMMVIICSDSKWTFLQEYALLLCSKNVNIRRAIICLYFSIIGVILAFCALSYFYTGVFYEICYDDGLKAFEFCGLGVSHPAAIMCVGCALYVFFKKDKNITTAIGICILGIVFSQFACACKTAAMCIAFLLLVYIVGGVINEKKEDKMPLYSYIVLCVVLIINVVIFTLSYIDAVNTFPEPWGHIIDVVTADRVYACNIEMAYYSPWTLFGQSYDGTLHFHITEYTGLDIGLVYYLVKFGVIATLLYWGMYIYTCVLMIKNKLYYVAWIMSMFLLYASYESELIGLPLNPFVLLMVCVFGNSKKIKECITGKEYSFE